MARGKFQSISGISNAHLCMAGVGIARMAEHLAMPAIREGTLVPLLTDYLVVDETAIYAVFQRSAQQNSRVLAFVNYLVAEIGKEPWNVPTVG